MELTKNERAFLHTITVSELGQGLIDADPHHGYGVIVGSTVEHPILFDDFSTHPNKLVAILDKHGNPVLDKDGKPLESTAAGAFQILHHFFTAYQHQMALPDFTPDSQERIAIQMLQECGARSLINQGDIEGAIHLARSRWASFPGAGYGQHEHPAQHLLDVYEAALEPEPIEADATSDAA